MKPCTLDEADATREAANAARFRTNLAALSRVHPEVAALIEETPIPNGVRRVRGRDGSATFLVPDSGSGPGARLEWFGGSSMPRVSTTELLSGFVSDGSSVTLPGILTGVEPLVIAAKSPAHSAIFVIEEDAAGLKLALHLHDYAELLAGGRLILIPGDDVTGRLRSFFERNIGYELPSRIIRVPQRTDAQLTELQGMIESAGADVARSLSRRIASGVDAIARRGNRVVSESPRVALLSTDPRPMALAQAAGIARALEHLGWAHEVCVPDMPCRCHAVARLSAVERIDPDLVLFVNGAGENFRALLPRDLPVVSWLLPSHAEPAEAGGTSNVERKDADLLLVPSPAWRRRFVAAGVPGDLVAVCDIAVDDATDRPIRLTDDQEVEFGCDGMVIADVPDDRPESCGVGLDSHVALWRALQEEVAADPLAYRSEDRGDILRRAERMSGTKLRDESSREQFENVLEVCIAPACLARSVVDTLAGDGFLVGTCGANWPKRAGVPEVRYEAIPTGRALNAIFNAARIVVLLSLSPASVQLALNAIAAGSRVLLRGSADAFEAAYPGLVSVAPCLHYFSSRAELGSTAATLLRSECALPIGRDRARSVLLREHTLVHRLRQIVSIVRNRMGNRPLKK